MAEIKAGVVVVTRFCKSNSKEFSSYIDYIDKKEEVREKYLSEYNLYNDYMEKSEKTSGLFTQEKMNLSIEEKKGLKEIFKTAQKRESLMWQTIISFDNRWLAEYGIMDKTNEVLDERKLKELTVGAIGKMLKNEELDNAIWSAGIHYDTDNVHIHIATVEEDPKREKKEYIQYAYKKDTDGEYVLDASGVYIKANKGAYIKNWGAPIQRYRKEIMMDTKGNEISKSEYIGRFKGKSIELCKKYMVDNILQQQEQNIMLNKIVREQIIKQKKNNPLLKDADLKEKFLEIHKALPRTGNRGLWNYNNHAMEKVRPLVDELSARYLEKYHLEEYNEFKKILARQSDGYETAYGQSNEHDFEKNKYLDLFERLGNAILKEIKTYDKEVAANEEKFQKNTENEVYSKGFEKGFEHDEPIYIPYDEPDRDPEAEPRVKQLKNEENKQHIEVHYEWSDEYKKAMKFMFGDKKKNIEVVYDKAIYLLEKESEKGNALAMFELGNVYQYGRGKEINKDKATEYYKMAHESFCYIYKKTMDKEPNNYLEYRIGKQYYQGQGVEKDFEEARAWLSRSSEHKNKYAHYSLGNIYYYGQGVESDIKKATQLYLKATVGGNAYASYKLGEIYQKGQSTDIDLEKANTYYKSAFAEFARMEDNQANDNLEYRLGMMLLNGIGVESNLNEATIYLKKASKAGNAYAQYQLAKIYLEQGDKESINMAIELLEKSAKKGNNVMAQYSLGKIYLSEDAELQDMGKAIYWLEKASANENSFASYTLGKIYNKEGDYFDKTKAIKFFTIAGTKNNEYAQYSLGKIYLEEETKNISEAVKWLELSAENGNQYAQYTLGKIFTNREEGVFNAERGILFLEKSAEQENEYAQLALGMIYLKGNIIEKDKEVAKKWLIKSAENGNQYAKEVLENIDKNGSHKQRHMHGKLSGYELERSLMALKRSMNKQVEEMQNLREYERLMEGREEKSR